VGQYDRDADAIRVLQVDTTGVKLPNPRSIRLFGAQNFLAAVAEAMVTLTPVVDGVAGGTITSYQPSAGKKLKLTAMSITTRNAGAAVQGVVVNLRMSNTGAVTTASPIVASIGAGTTQAVANSVDSALIPLDLEISGNMQIGISEIGTATAGNTVTLIGYEY
jgi:hypothetical protein